MYSETSTIIQNISDLYVACKKLFSQNTQPCLNGSDWRKMHFASLWCGYGIYHRGLTTKANYQNPVQNSYLHGHFNVVFILFWSLTACGHYMNMYHEHCAKHLL